MKSSALQVIFWVLLIFCNTVQPRPQSKPPKKEAPSSISGKVTIKGKGVPGIVVGVRADSGGQWTSRHKGTTDQEGNYKITNVRPGTYRVMPAAPALVNLGDPEGKTLIVTEGETVEDIDFALARGGVITGRVVDSDGLPLIEEQISLLPADGSSQIPRGYMGAPGGVQTDDRGIYRIFGMASGKYKVAVGQSEDPSFAGRSRRSQYKQTFSPGVMDAAKAAVIEVTEGSEATNVDITMGRPVATFTVTGRIVDGETLQPIPNVRLGLQKIVSDQNFITSWGSASSSQGEFKLESVTPGKYAVIVASQPNSGVRADSVPFEVIDQDVSGLLVKTSEGGSLSGVIVLEGTNDKSVVARLSQAQLHTHVTNGANEGPGSWLQPVTINSDGSFRVAGLQSGFANFSLTGTDRRPVVGLTLLRLERDGVAQPRGVEIKDREQVTGVRLVVRYGNGTIRGVVKIENGELPLNARFSVWFTNPDDDPTGVQRTSLPSPQVDSRGHFLVEGLVAGTYQVNAVLFIPGSRTRPPSVTQQVNVADGTVTEVTLTLNLEPRDPGKP